MHLTVCSSHVRYACQSESTLYIWLNVKKLLARNRRDIWSLSDSNGNRTHNQLVCKQRLNHLPKLTKWLSWIVSTNPYGAFDCMFLSFHVRLSERIYSLYLTECQGTPWSKQARYRKFKSLQRDSNPQPLSWYTNTKPLVQTDQMIELKFQYLSVRCIWLYLLIMSRTRFRVNLRSIFAWMSKNC